MPKHKPDRCETYPDCACRERADHWGRVVTTLPNGSLSEQQYDEAVLLCAVLLSCMCARCPDRRDREWARRQMMSPTFAKYLQH